MESEHTKGILMRNLTYISRFSRLPVTLLKANFPHASDFFINDEIEFLTL